MRLMMWAIKTPEGTSRTGRQSVSGHGPESDPAQLGARRSDRVESGLEGGRGPQWRAYRDELGPPLTCCPTPLRKSTVMLRHAGLARKGTAVTTANTEVMGFL